MTRKRASEVRGRDRPLRDDAVDATATLRRLHAWRSRRIEPHDDGPGGAGWPLMDVGHEDVLDVGHHQHVLNRALVTVQHVDRVPPRLRVARNRGLLSALQRRVEVERHRREGRAGGAETRECCDDGESCPSPHDACSPFPLPADQGCARTYGGEPETDSDRLEAGDDAQEELASPGAVNDSVVDGAREPPDLAGDNLAVTYGRTQPDAVEAENRHLRVVDKRCGEEAPEPTGARDRKRGAA